MASAHVHNPHAVNKRGRKASSPPDAFRPLARPLARKPLISRSPFFRCRRAAYPLHPVVRRVAAYQAVERCAEATSEAQAHEALPLQTATDCLLKSGQFCFSAAFWSCGIAESRQTLRNNFRVIVKKRASGSLAGRLVHDIAQLTSFRLWPDRVQSGRSRREESLMSLPQSVKPGTF